MKKTRLLQTTEDILAHLSYIRNKKQEYFVCLSLDSGGKLIKRRTVTIGLLDVSLVHPRELFAGPLKDRAAAVIIAHNHPSGWASPSFQDIKTTQQVVAAGLILGIRIQDHLIVTPDSHYSFKKNSLLE